MAMAAPALWMSCYLQMSMSNMKLQHSSQFYNRSYLRIECAGFGVKWYVLLMALLIFIQRTLKCIIYHWIGDYKCYL